MRRRGGNTQHVFAADTRASKGVALGTCGGLRRINAADRVQIPDASLKCE
jgi:hypothetical protein